MTAESLALPKPSETAGDVRVQIVRTVPERVYAAVSGGDFGIFESYVAALSQARNFIYLENQFLWSPEITEILREKLRRPPNDRFRILLVLPVKPATGTDDTRGALAELVEADGDAGRFLACTLYARHGALSDPVYVHAKVGVVDDTWLTFGSANLNEHSLFNDTEMNVVTHDRRLARETRIRLWAEHLELPVDELGRDPSSVIDRHWKPISRDQLDRLASRRPLTHRVVRLPGVSKRSERLLDSCRVWSSTAERWMPGADALLRVNQGLSGCSTSGERRPWAATEAVRPPPDPRSTEAALTAARTPSSGPTT